MKKKILTLDDLVVFCKAQKLCNFNSNETNTQLIVQVPATFEIDSNTSIDDTIMYCNTKVFHIGPNRNGSAVTEDAAIKCLDTLAYKPLLANFCEIDGIKDFTSHDMVMSDDDISYIEKQIGCITADKATIEYDESLDKNFVCARVAIPRNYTDACEIIERKGGTKVSVELMINQMNYSEEDELLYLEDITVMGLTCLGVDPDTGDAIQEGMEGACLTIESFNKHNNSIISNSNYSNGFDVALIDILKKLDDTISSFNKNKIMEGGSSMNKFDELLQKYNVTAEAVTFEYDGLSDEELEAKFAEAFGNEPMPEPTPEPAPSVYSMNEDGDVTLTFQLSHDDIRSNIYNVLYSEDEANNSYTYIYSVYDDCFVYGREYSDGTFKTCKRKYSVSDNGVVLDTMAVEVVNQWLTKEECDAIESMRNEYNELKAYKETIDSEKLMAEKNAVLESNDYEVVAETEEFKSLVADVANFSVDEIKVKADVILAKFAKAQFAAEKTTGTTSIGININTSNTNEYKPYGGLFD